MGEIVEMGSFKYLGQDDELHNIHFVVDYRETESHPS